MNTLVNDEIDDHIDFDPNQDPWEVLTGPGGKFDKSRYTDEDEHRRAIARAKLEADVTIAANNRRMDELRKDYEELRKAHNEGASVKDLLDQFKAQMNNSNNSNHPADEGNKPVYDPNEVKSLISSTVQEMEKDRREASNFNKVDQKLRETYGANYATKIKQQIEELGLSVADADNLAKRSPEAFFRTFGLNQQQQQSFEAPMRGQRTGFAPNVQVRDNAYYTELKKKDRDLYFSPKIQAQMIKDIEELGPKFGKVF